ncbi:MAG TPA: ATP-binding protein [Burkholderiaceae bacterium]|nr:ATP-binding protein [Burkholderiaceae bacterium]
MTEPAPLPERRRDDRRRHDRRAGHAFSPTLVDESLFDAIGAEPEAFDTDRSHPAAADSRFGSGWADVSQPADSRFLSRQAQRIVTTGDSTFERLFATFIGARVVLGMALLAAQLITPGTVTRGSWALLLSVVYLAQSLTLWLGPRLRSGPRRRMTRLSRRLWAATIGFDLVAFSLLHVLEPASTFNYVALLVLPVLMGGVLTSRVAAMATAAAATLLLLGAAWRGGLADPALALTPAGLMGIGLFVIALLAGELAARLAREEITARGSLELARQQAQLNRLVIEEMVDGVLVIDRRARVRAANPAARRLLAERGLGEAAPFQLQDDPAWTELAARVPQAFEAGHWPDDALEPALRFAGGATRTLRLRARFTRARARDGDAGAAEREVLCVLFMEDLRNVQARMRTEKLAAMGRVSAGIAHEIRNPLAAIAQANALMSEETTPAEQQMLTAMVADNVERLKRIVDDVMEVAPGPDAEPRAIDLGAEVGRIVADWARTSRVALGPGSRLQVELPTAPLVVLFDPEHLRRVLVNLLDNARRYASDRTGAIELVVRALSRTEARVSVASDGDPIPPDIEPFLFEPFFSTRSRGTGLGLYICRELCERYGGSIDYWQHPAGSQHRNEFVVTARVATDNSAAALDSRLL